MNRNIIFFIAILLGFVAFVLAWFAGNRYLTNKAYHDCATISSYTVKQGDATITYPVPEVYQECLKRVQ